MKLLLDFFGVGPPIRAYTLHKFLVASLNMAKSVRFDGLHESCSPTLATPLQRSCRQQAVAMRCICAYVGRK